MKKSHKNILIITLCLIICLMAVAYMAFSAKLSIKVTGNVNKNWNIKIENISTSNIFGTATDKEEPTHTDDTATFYSLLSKPGDSIEYAVKITNYGNVNASLKNLKLDYEENSDIEFSSSGFYVGDIIRAGESKTLYVKVKYSENGKGSNKIASLTVNLQYEQAGSLASSFSTVTGNIIYDNAPCNNCSVILYNDCREVYETTTDLSGNYKMINIVPGNYDIYVKNNYYSTRKIISVNSGDYTVNLTIEKGVNTPICTS